MKFPCVFTRSLSGGAGNLGTDTLPSAAPTKILDNVLYSRFSNINGWPIHRIAVLFNGPTNITAARMFFFESTTGMWFKIGADAAMTSGSVTFFDTVAIAEPPPVGANALQGATDGSIMQFLQVDKPGAAADGTYTFAMAGDLSTPT